MWHEFTIKIRRRRFTVSVSRSSFCVRWIVKRPHVSTNTARWSTNLHKLSPTSTIVDGIGLLKQVMSYEGTVKLRSSDIASNDVLGIMIQILEPAKNLVSHDAFPDKILQIPRSFYCTLHSMVRITMHLVGISSIDCVQKQYRGRTCNIHSTSTGKLLPYRDTPITSLTVTFYWHWTYRYRGGWLHSYFAWLTAHLILDTICLIIYCAVPG